MVKAIWMPDLYQFNPGFFDLSARGGGSEFEHLIIVRYAFFPHGCLRLWQGSVAETLLLLPVPFLLATVSRRIRPRPRSPPPLRGRVRVGGSSSDVGAYRDTPSSIPPLYLF